LIVEKVDVIMNEEYTSLKDEELITIFKNIKDKIINLIQKDTIAAVRDAAVSLLTTFKALLFDNQIVNETVNGLPKYRITEINKVAAERCKEMNRPLA
jgi:predicted PurR-regulated permease PerM